MKSIRTGTLMLLITVFYVCLFSGCGQQDEAKAASHKGTPRDAAPSVLEPAAAGSTVYGDDQVQIDASNSSSGYFMVKYSGDADLVKLRVTTPDLVSYIYTVSTSGNFDTIPFTEGNGEYKLEILEHVEADQYATLFTQLITIQISDEYLPFLYPNQFVNFTKDSAVVKKGAELAKETYSDIDVISNIYNYVTKNITYDEQKAEEASSSVMSDFIPDLDASLAEGKGICFDYAAIMCAMLRSQKIPTKLEIGYAAETFHAWISTYTKETGWVDKIIEFDGKSWKLMDPTFGANNKSKDVKKFIGDGKNYHTKYVY